MHNYQCSWQPFLKRLTVIHFICPAIVGLLFGFTVCLIEIMCCIIVGVNQCASPNLSQHVGSYIGQVSVQSWMSLGWVSPVVGHTVYQLTVSFFMVSRYFVDRSPKYHRHLVNVILQAAITAPEVCMRIYMQNCLFQGQSSFCTQETILVFTCP